MICSKCGQEVKENLVKFPKLGIEVDFTQEQNDTEFKDIKIRKGWRLLRIGELGEVMDYIVTNKLDIWSFFEQPIKSHKGKYVARFNADSGRAALGCGGNPDDSGPGLGVVFCRDVKVKK